MRYLRAVWRAERGRVVAHLRGDLDADARPVFDGIRVVTQLERNVVTIDLSEVRFIDPSGLRLLEELAATEAVRFRDPSPPVERLIDLVGGADALPMVDAGD